MKASFPWRGVRLRTLETGRDPDAPSHRVSVPADWSETAARGFVGLCLGDAPSGWDAIRLPEAADRWIGRLTRAGRCNGQIACDDFAETLHCLLLLRQGCPGRGVWRGEAGDRFFVLNLAGFADPDTGFDEPCLMSAVQVAGLATVLDTGGRGVLRLADLDGMLARLGLDYDSEAGRDMACEVLRLVRRCVAGLDVSVEAAPAGDAEALLGVETAGFAPAFSLVGGDGTLTMAARARLACLGLSPERALAMSIDGVLPIKVAGTGAHAAMHDAIASAFDATPPRPRAATTPRLVASGGTPSRRALPARSKGFTQKVTIGGQRVFLRTAEYDDGSLGEIAVTLGGREGSMAKGLAEACATAISLGLQHGVSLDRFVEAFAHGRFGACGAVEGDPSILSASSPLDYVVRALSEAYLGRHLADPPAETADDEPLLPLGLGETGGAANSERVRQRSLRLVSRS